MLSKKNVYVLIIILKLKTIHGRTYRNKTNHVDDSYLFQSLYSRKVAEAIKWKSPSNSADSN